jgi:hypothetical protein
MPNSSPIPTLSPIPRVGEVSPTLTANQTPEADFQYFCDHPDEEQYIRQFETLSPRLPLADRVVKKSLNVDCPTHYQPRRQVLPRKAILFQLYQATRVRIVLSDFLGELGCK